MIIGPYKFANPEFLWLLILIPLVVVWYIKMYQKKISNQKIPTLKAFENLPRSPKEYIRHLLLVLRLLAVLLIIVALARPQTMFDKSKVTSEGIDIVLAIDLSSSMLARDFTPDRIGAAKNVAEDFINGRPDDRIGLVTFAAESYTQCPITTDHTVLLNLLHDVKSGILDDGTAIGLGLATCVDRLKDSPGKSKVVILLTDGVNNQGSIHPLTAGEIAQAFKIRVYTVGVGTIGNAPYPVQTPFGIQYQNMEVQIDEALLQQIADMTGGKYYRATNTQKLKNIYKEIDKLEKTKIEVTSYQRFTDKFLYLILGAIGLLIIEMILRNTLLSYYP